MIKNQLNKMAFQNYGDKLEFRQIVLGHLKRILEITSRELRDNTQTIIRPDHSEVSFREDTRISFIQSIESLSQVLLPYFDKKIQDVYDVEIKIMNGWEYEIKKLKKEIRDKIIADIKEEGIMITDQDFVIKMKLISAKRLFSELNLLLKRNDYLKRATYQDDDSESVEDEDGGS